MATKKSPTTKAKTKTASKSSTTKTTKSADVKAIAPAKVINIDKLRSLHMVSVGIFALLAVLAGMLMTTDSYQLTVRYLTEDILAANGTLAPAARVIYDIEIRWVLIAVMTLSALFPLLYITRWEKSYNQAVTTGRTVVWRWIDFAITGALILKAVALLGGIQDVLVLKLIGGSVVLSFWLAWVAEKQNDGATKSVWPTYAASIAAGVLPWSVILIVAVATVIFGGVWAPWYVYALYAVAAAGAISLACIQFTHYRRKLAAWQDNYLLVERNYVAASLLTKVAFAIIVIAAFQK